MEQCGSSDKDKLVIVEKSKQKQEDRRKGKMECLIVDSNDNSVTNEVKRAKKGQILKEKSQYSKVMMTEMISRTK